ncbi:MAG: hypothetical protein WBQ25_08915 [Nitrososphaeraceae archaeon]
MSAAERVGPPFTPQILCVGKLTSKVTTSQIEDCYNDHFLTANSFSRSLKGHNTTDDNN